MATTQISYTEPTPNGAGATLDAETLVAAPTDNMQIQNAEPEQTILVVTNTDGGGGTVDITVKAGPNPPALAGGQGDLVETVADGDTVYIGPFESGRFLQSDGSLLIESDATTGTIGALFVSRKA